MQTFQEKITAALVASGERKVVITVISLVFLTMTYLANAQYPPKEVGTKVLYRVLLFKWKEGVTPEQIDTMSDLWNGLVAKVDGLTSFEMKEVTSGNFHHVVILKFSSKEALDRYSIHEDHRKLAEMGPALVEGFSEFDYLDQE